jgi:type II secretory pathway pseudopilin PulG
METIGTNKWRKPGIENVTHPCSRPALAFKLLELLVFIAIVSILASPLAVT